MAIIVKPKKNDKQLWKDFEKRLPNSTVSRPNWLKYPEQETENEGKIMKALKRIVPPVASKRLFFLVMLLIVCIAGVERSTGQNATVPDATHWQAVFEDFSLTEIEAVQTDLTSLGYDTLGIDGKIGPNTSAALNSFLVDFRVEPTDNFADDLTQLLRHYADINADVTQAHPTWKQLRFSEGVDSWIEDQSEPEKAKNNGIRRTGTAQEIIGLLDAYKSEQQPISTTSTLEKPDEPQPDSESQQAPDEPAQSDETASEPADPLAQIKADGQLFSLDAEQESAVVEEAQKTLPEIQWKADACGCSPPDYPIFKDYLYSFYPFWMADGSEQTVDFSLCSRIGYYAAFFDNTGTLKAPSHWQNKRPNANFINLAHQYKTEVDLVVYVARKDIDALNAEKAKAIVDAIEPKLKGFVNWIKPYISFLQSPARRMGDGVTIYFDANWAEKNQVEKIKGFIEELRTELRAAGAEVGRFAVTDDVLMNQDEDGTSESQKLYLEYFHLNVMLPMKALNDENLKTFLRETSPNVNLFLIVLEDPQPEQEMRDLRNYIEASFKIDKAIEILNKTVPIINPGEYQGNLKDAFRYFQWNFKGVGLSPIPLKESNLAQVDGPIDETFLKNLDVSPVCETLCPLRWHIRILIFFVCLMLISYGLLSIPFSGLRAIWGVIPFEYALVAAILIAGLLLMTLWCDPFWAKHQLQVLLFFVVLLIAAGVGMRIRKKWESTFP